MPAGLLLLLLLQGRARAGQCTIRLASKRVALQLLLLLLLL